ncbi:hypothetical protein HY004_01080 [Candidatus Saccharibacteria bacterium]|nr:hypothetical protein [Candidatus Saccharibacteria bacterium]
MSKEKGQKKNRKNILLIAAIVILVAAVITGILLYYSMTNTSIINKNNSSSSIKKTGGKISTFTDEYQRAKNALKSGDKASAKASAKNALEENNRLSIEDQSKIQGQAEKMKEMANIAEGKDPQ